MGKDKDKKRSSKDKDKRKDGAPREERQPDAGVGTTAAAAGAAAGALIGAAAAAAHQFQQAQIGTLAGQLGQPYMHQPSPGRPVHQPPPYTIPASTSAQYSLPQVLPSWIPLVQSGTTHSQLPTSQSSMMPAMPQPLPPQLLPSQPIPSQPIPPQPLPSQPLPSQHMPLQWPHQSLASQASSPLFTEQIAHHPHHPPPYQQPPQPSFPPPQSQPNFVHVPMHQAQQVLPPPSLGPIFEEGSHQHIFSALPSPSHGTFSSATPAAVPAASPASSSMAAPTQVPRFTAQQQQPLPQTSNTTPNAPSPAEPMLPIDVPTHPAMDGADILSGTRALFEDYRRCLTSLEELINGKLQVKKDELASAAQSIESIMGAVKQAQADAQAEIDQDAAIMTERLEAAARQKLSILEHDLAAYEVGIESIDSFVTEVVDGLATKDTIGSSYSGAAQAHQLLRKEPELMRRARNMLQKPLPQRTSVAVHDLPREVAERARRLEHADTLDQLLRVKDSMLWSMLNEAQAKDTEREQQLEQMTSYVQSLHSGSESELRQWSELADEYQHRLQTVSSRLAEAEYQQAQAQAVAKRAQEQARAAHAETQAAQHDAERLRSHNEQLLANNEELRAHCERLSDTRSSVSGCN